MQILSTLLLVPQQCQEPVCTQCSTPLKRQCIYTLPALFDEIFFNRVKPMDWKEKDITPWLQQNKSFSLNLEHALIFQAGSCLCTVQGLTWLSWALGKCLPPGKVWVSQTEVNMEPKKCCSCFYTTPCLFSAMWSSNAVINDIFFKCGWLGGFAAW